MAKKSKIHVSKAAVTETWMKESDFEVICKAWENFQGQVEVFESAVGALLVGRLGGYDVLRVLHSWRTLKNYEEILDIKFKDVLPARTADSRRVNGIRYAEKFEQFWKAIAGGVASEPNARVAIKE
jgi:hypothetical protein